MGLRRYVYRPPKIATGLAKRLTCDAYKNINVLDARVAFKATNVTPGRS